MLPALHILKRGPKIGTLKRRKDDIRIQYNYIETTLIDEAHAELHITCYRLLPGVLVIEYQPFLYIFLNFYSIFHQNSFNFHGIARLVLSKIMKMETGNELETISGKDFINNRTPHLKPPTHPKYVR